MRSSPEIAGTGAFFTGSIFIAMVPPVAINLTTGSSAFATPVKHRANSTTAKTERKYLAPNGSSFAIDKEMIKSESRYDGKWVLRTNTTLPAAEVALKYKQLWMVEQLFRSAKSLLGTRPIFHKYDRTIRGHVFCSGTGIKAGAPGKT
ncbi:MAG: hypothetical protein ACLPVO_08355 [Desulfomonilaceae bacterium]